MALALYRKYRPATFAEVVGQEHVTGPLMTAVDSGRINHAYLFSGPRGCGKTSSARILARSLNCEQGPTSAPCGVCQSCIDLAPDGSGNIDVIEIDAASHGGVDDARELRERAFQLPVQSRYKIYIIDEAHMVSNQGFNALLKVVEEPPESVVFIFATTEPDKVLPTIRSRTHHYPFRLVPPAVMRDLLERNCASEGVAVGPAVLPLVVRAGGGSVRDSQSLLDQLIAGAGPEGITYDEALALLGVTDSALLDDMVEAIGVADGATVFGTVNRLVDAGHDPRRFAGDLLDRLRDLILMAAVPDAGNKGLIDAPQDQLERLADQAGRLGLSTLSRLADIVHVGLTEMRGTTAPRLGLELICARMLLPAVGDDAASLTQRIERLERRVEIGGVPSSGPRSVSGSQRVSGGSGSQASGRSSAAGRAAPADGLTPRQRAEAALAAERPARPAAPGPDSKPAVPDGAPAAPAAPALAEPAPAQPAPEALAPAPDPRPAAPAPAEPAPEAPAPDPRLAAPTPVTRQSATSAPDPRPASSAPEVSAVDEGWPEVVAPGSGRGHHPVSSATPVAPEPTVQAPETSEPPEPVPDEQPAPQRTTQASAAPSGPLAASSGPPASPSGPPAVQAPPPPAAAHAGGSDFDIVEVRRQWRGVVDHIKRISRASAALVETATPVRVSGDVLMLSAPSALVRRLSDPHQHEPLIAALRELLGVNWKIEVADGAVPAGAQSQGVADQRPPDDEYDDMSADPDDESVTDRRCGLDPGQAAVNLLRDELGAEEIDAPGSSA